MVDTKKKVSFDDVQVREYPIVLSLNPAGHYGPAIEIGWEYRLASELLPLKHVKYEKRATPIDLAEGRVAVKEYEQIRPSSFRRKEKNLYLFVNQREYYVKKNNFTDTEIQEATKEKEALYVERSRSNKFRNPAVRVKETLAANRRTRKVKRAVRNLKKNKDNGIDGRSNIYSGWQLPLSAYLF